MPDLPSRRPLTGTIASAAALAGAVCLLAAFAFPPGAFARPAASPDTPPEIAEKYDQVTNEILCWCGCARQSLRDCTCGFSHTVRTSIENDLKAGKTPDELIAALVNEHGDQVRIVPEAKGFDRLAWIGPGIAILLGAGVVFLVLRRWTLPAAPGPQAVASPDDEVRDDAYRERLARSLSRMDT